MPPITNPKEGEAERFYDDLQELLELTPKKKKKKDVLFIIGDWNAKAGIQEIPRVPHPDIWQNQYNIVKLKNKIN